MDIPQIIYEEGIEFDDEEKYNNFVKYCEWYIFDGDYAEVMLIPREDCAIFKQLCFLFVEPNYIDREMIKHCALND